MTTGDGSVPPLKVDPELLERYGNQLLTAAGNLPAAPPPFVVTGTDPISAAIAEKLPAMEGAFQTELPQLQADATKTASNIVAAAGHYTRTDQQLAADYEKHQFDRANAAGGGGAPGTGGGGGAGGSNSMGQLMGMPMQMASQVAQVPMQVMGAVTSVPQGIMQGVQQLGQMAGGAGAPDGQTDASASGPGEPEDPRDDEKDERSADDGAAARDTHAERAPEPAPVAPQRSSPRHAAPDPTIDL